MVTTNTEGEDELLVLRF